MSYHDQAKREGFWATLGWHRDDVRLVARSRGEEMSEEEAQEWLEKNEKYIEQAMADAGFDAIRALLS